MILLLTRSVLCRDALMSRMQEHMSVMTLHRPLKKTRATEMNLGWTWINQLGAKKMCKLLIWIA